MNKTQNKIKHDGPGRPSFASDIVWPKGNFTLEDLCVANGVNPKTGKGKRCSKLTLIKSMDRDRFMTNEKTGKPDKTRPRRTSLLVLTDEKEEPKNRKGLGRKRLVYRLRDQANATRKAATVTARKSSKSMTVPAVSISSTPTADALDKIHAALTAPDPAEQVPPQPATAPVVESTPEAPAAEPTPVVTPADNPATVASEIVTAPTAELVNS